MGNKRLKTKFHPWAPRFLAALLVFAGLLDNFPQLHPHQAEHACTEIGGEHYYLSADAFDLRLSPGREYALVRVSLGAGHHHDPCALCHLLPQFLGVDPAQGFLVDARVTPLFALLLPSAQNGQTWKRARAPPQPA